MNVVKLVPSEFERLAEYSGSVPTGTTIGRRWKSRAKDGWRMGEYVGLLPELTCCRYHRCISGVLDDVECTVVQDSEGKVYDPAKPEDWHERPNRQVEIRWSRIEILPIVRRSRAEDDPLCFARNTGWFINSPEIRNAEVAGVVGIDRVYCVGMNPGRVELPDVLYLQPSGHLDDRNAKVEYFVVEDREVIKRALARLRRPLSKDEQRQSTLEHQRNLDLARRGLL